MIRDMHCIVRSHSNQFSNVNQKWISGCSHHLLVNYCKRANTNVPPWTICIFLLWMVLASIHHTDNGILPQFCHWCSFLPEKQIGERYCFMYLHVHLPVLYALYVDASTTVCTNESELRRRNERTLMKHWLYL